jgi:outer membrane lipoprotein-sorting protein
MKKLLLLLAILAGSISFAQQEISNSQQELSKKTSARVQAFNKQVDTKLAKIVNITKLGQENHKELRELIATKDMRLIRLDREGKDAENLETRRNEILTGYNRELKRILGKDKYALLSVK